ncbi:hypothetical protein SEA_IWOKEUPLIKEDIS_86 [Mycobacterium phage Iwokeuplikedis]|nr:hypothetical protein SEA_IWOKEUPLIKEDIS_86 [Mycobacterium phage Iwokeuplikedis]
MIRRTLLALVLLAMLAVGVLLVGPSPAEAATPECWAHLAERPGTTPAADRRYHLERGEPSPCTEADAAESSSDGSDHDDEKSRYCRKRWFC